MFKPGPLERALDLETGTVLLWDGHYYVVKTKIKLSPGLTDVVLVPVSPALSSRKETLRSDGLVATYTWHP